MKRTKLRNKWKDLVDPIARPPVNAIIVRSNESSKHRVLKCLVCNKLVDMGYHFYTEAKLTNGKRPDVIDIDRGIAIEILVSEKEESIERKKEYYLGLTIIEIRTKEDVVKIT